MIDILIAYPYMKKTVIQGLFDNKEQIRFLLDCGAFTVHKTKQIIKLDDYCNFIEKLPITPWRYFTLDVIGDPKLTLSQYNEMIKRGFKPLPIYTKNEKREMLEYYYQTSDVVGLSIGGDKKYVNGMMSLIGDRKVHLLGFTRFEYLKHYKPYMCDSSTFQGTSRYGRINLYLGNGNFKTINRYDMVKKPSEYILNTIQRLGINPYLLTKESNWRRVPSVSLSITTRSWLMYQQEIFKLFGTHLFLAITNMPYLKVLLDEMSALRKLGLVT